MLFLFPFYFHMNRQGALANRGVLSRSLPVSVRRRQRKQSPGAPSLCLAAAVTQCVASGKSLHPSEPQCPHPERDGRSGNRARELIVFEMGSSDAVS